MVVGRSKIGKTQFALQLSLHVATGVDFSHLKIPNSRRVHYFNGELRPLKIRERIEEVLNQRLFAINAMSSEGSENEVNLASKNFNITNIRGYIPENPGELAEIILEQASRSKAELVILDPLYSLLDGSENESHVAKEACMLMSRITKETGACVLYVHHDTKGKNTGDKDTIDRGSGSGLLQRFYDFSIILSEQKDDPNVIVVESCNRDYISIEPFCYQRAGCLFVPCEQEPEKRTTKSDRSGRLRPDTVEECREWAVERILRSFNEDTNLSTAELRRVITSQFSLSKRQAEQIETSLKEWIRGQGADSKIILKKAWAPENPLSTNTIGLTVLRVILCVTPQKLRVTHRMLVRVSHISPLGDVTHKHMKKDGCENPRQVFTATNLKEKRVKCPRKVPDKQGILLYYNRRRE